MTDQSSLDEDSNGTGTNAAHRADEQYPTEGIPVDDESAPGRFSRALRQAIDARGVTLAWLHRRLADRGTPVSMAALSYWRSGARQPEGVASLAALDTIEMLLGCDSGALMDLVQSTPRMGRVAVPRLPAAQPLPHEEHERVIEETERTLGVARSESLRDLSSTLVGYVGADGRLERLTTRSLVQATYETIRALPLYEFSAGPDAPLKTITDVRGGTVRPTYRHPGGRLICDVFDLDAPLPAGATAMIEFTEVLPEGYAEPWALSHMVVRPARQVVVWLHFHPAALPLWCEEFVRDDTVERVREMRLAGTSVHVYRFSFGPGELGIRWGYDIEGGGAPSTGTPSTGRPSPGAPE